MDLNQDTALADLVVAYRKAASNLRAVARNGQDGASTRHSRNQQNILTVVIGELTRRGEQELAAALVQEHEAHINANEAKAQGAESVWRNRDVREARRVIRRKLDWQPDPEQAHTLALEERARREAEVMATYKAKFDEILSGTAGGTTLAKDKAMIKATNVADQYVLSRNLLAFTREWYRTFVLEYTRQFEHYTRLFQAEADDLHEAWLDAQGAEDDGPMFTLEYVAETSINGMFRRVPFTCAGEFGLDQLDYQVELLFEGRDVHEITIKRVDPECR